MRPKVIFDTDPGIDDTMAMLFLEKSPASAAAYMINPNLFKVKEGKIRVLIDGIAMGYTMIKEDKKVYPYDEFSHNPSQKYVFRLITKRF